MIILLGLLLGLAGPAAGEEVTDLAGRKVQVPARGERIVMGEGRFLAALGILERDDAVRRAYGVVGRVEACSRGFCIVLADRALTEGERSNTEGMDS
ncbi:hypothetical protein [Azospirillum soli]|uniref:hypothetical protein n=1 Tax=Azospirillum soli TaxID=1304799 RepID=UPI001AE46A96|nr:hypothetical protein [Azospirillum soli]MBP2315728.1 ABC-type Fe3+-hydroxamate transport system substrate-binding protein [Azospirillum soli]